ncbi:phosphohistidine phosphatase SixA [Rheinheimera sp. A13L]|uniref:phosphohistidine phosphatase SixA n=1 Tax=Rheinheimera sp. A13L TaxID=506534 RepID=UPI00021256B8|nr:phosphohistidine phosphatase SixA [Rheinheimera sp. A13L]EGM76709.1 phosphohistidine phosphatase SixA [Rheinheimera sp. A13L]
MKAVLYLMRHATADIRNSLVDEADRCLNEKGRLQARRVADFMHKQGLIPDRIFCSPHTKAVQTAALVRKDSGVKTAVEEWHCLLPAVAVTEVKEHLFSQLQDNEAVLLVGHEPELALLINELLGLDKTFIELKKASLTCLELDSESTVPVRLAWSVPAKFM